MHCELELAEPVPSPGARRQEPCHLNSGSPGVRPRHSRLQIMPSTAHLHRFRTLSSISILKNLASYFLCMKRYGNEKYL